MTDLLIVGAGGFARETAAAVHAINQAGELWNLLGFLDDDPALAATTRAGTPIVGTTAALSAFPGAKIVVCVGSPRTPRLRERVVARLGLPDDRYATIVHPTAVLGAGSEVGHGSVLLAHVAVTAEVRIGAHVAVMPQTVLTHDDSIANFVTIASGVRLGGSVQVHAGAYLGAGALIRESVSVGAGALVGMGSVVLRDVPPGEVWVGNPATFLRSVTAQPVTAQPVTAQTPTAQTPAAHPPTAQPATPQEVGSTT